MKSKTYHLGASTERTAWINKLRRELRGNIDASSRFVLDMLLGWGIERRLRYEAKSGGLGRVKK